jgi:ABC-type transport system involved in multi-copper enzyme maturation permease subunit
MSFEPSSPPPSLGVPTLPVLVSAEVRKLASRTSARVALALLLLLGIGGPLLQLLVEQVIGRATAAGAENGAEMPEMLATYAVSGVLQVRNFFLFRGLLIWVAAESFAGELVARTLREDLVRPVTRESLLVAKWSAIQAFVVASLLVPVVAASGLAAVLLGTNGDWMDIIDAVVLTFLGDVAFGTLVMAISLSLRSVGGTLVGVFLFWLGDQVFGWLLWAVENGRPLLDTLLQAWGMTGLAWVVDGAIALRPWLPSSAMNLYWGFDAEVGVAWQSQVAVLVILLAAWGWALVVFRRMDVD